MAFADINGHRLRYTVEGDGPLLVFGHGLLGSIERVEEDQANLAELRRRVRLLLYDARGHGQSEGPSEPAGYSWETLGLDMVGLLDHLGEERAILAGGSMGAATALWAAIERPERVSALVLLMPPPLGFEEMRDEPERQALATLDLVAAMIENFGLEQTVEFVRQSQAIPDAPDADDRLRSFLALNPGTIVHAVRGLRAAPVHDPARYRQVRVPTLVLGHEGDPLHPARAARLAASMIDGARLAVAPAPDYWRANPAHFLAEVTAFLDALG